MATSPVLGDCGPELHDVQQNSPRELLEDDEEVGESRPEEEEEEEEDEEMEQQQWEETMLQEGDREEEEEEEGDEMHGVVVDLLSEVQEMQDSSVTPEEHGLQMGVIKPVILELLERTIKRATPEEKENWEPIRHSWKNNGLREFSEKASLNQTRLVQVEEILRRLVKEFPNMEDSEGGSEEEVAEEKKKRQHLEKELEKMKDTIVRSTKVTLDLVVESADKSKVIKELKAELDSVQEAHTVWKTQEKEEKKRVTEELDSARKANQLLDEQGKEVEGKLKALEEEMAEMKSQEGKLGAWKIPLTKKRRGEDPDQESGSQSPGLKEPRRPPQEVAQMAQGPGGTGAQVPEPPQTPQASRAVARLPVRASPARSPSRTRGEQRNPAWAVFKTFRMTGELLTLRAENDAFYRLDEINRRRTAILKNIWDAYATQIAVFRVKPGMKKASKEQMANTFKKVLADVLKVRSMSDLLRHLIKMKTADALEAPIKEGVYFLAPGMTEDRNDAELLYDRSRGCNRHHAVRLWLSVFFPQTYKDFMRISSIDPKQEQGLAWLFAPRASAQYYDCQLHLVALWLACGTFGQENIDQGRPVTSANFQLPDEDNPVSRDTLMGISAHTNISAEHLDLILEGPGEADWVFNNHFTYADKNEKMALRRLLTSAQPRRQRNNNW